ncbi:lachesin-like [Schistocerca nitens]|uniref:lachesin-like n=1 Tax=Schistocerca nitens TaxID=7011 RepID=UPI0021199324|nr:lachesin-like [Schistocerca nitens]
MIVAQLLTALLVDLATASPRQGTTILHISTDQTVNIGERVQLDCKVNNGGNYSVIWLHIDPNRPETPLIISSGSSLLTHNARYSVITDTATSEYCLLIRDIHDTDEGHYQCQVVISQNERITREVKLQIRKPPVILNNSTSTLTLREGQSVTLECFATGYPPPQVSWRRENNIPLPSGATIYRSKILQIPTVRKEDRGDYYCVADNGVGKAARRSVELNIEFAPIVNVARQRVGQALQYDADIECTVDGSPDPSVYWIRNGTALQSNNKYMIAYFSMRAGHSSAVLRINKVQANDYGIYLCKASNKLGASTATIEFFETQDPVCPPACNVRPVLNITGAASSKVQ